MGAYLERLLTSDFSKVDLVTTNYDLVIEYALEASGTNLINMGHQGGIAPSIKFDKWREEDLQVTHGHTSNQNR